MKLRTGWMHSPRTQNALKLGSAAILAAMLLVPLWIVEFPPLLDYPNHLARSFVLSHLQDPAFSFNRFFQADWGFYPYLGMDACMSVLCRLFPAELAGRIFLSLCVLGLAAAAWFFLRQVNRGEDATACWALLIAFNIFFLEGFLNFTLSLAVGFFALGLWLRWIASPGVLRWLAALLMFTVLYFTHLIGFGITGVVVIAFLAAGRRSLRDWAWSAALALPGVTFYFCGSRLGFGAGPVLFNGFLAKLNSMRMILRGYSPPLDYISLAAVGIWFIAAWWRNPEFRWNGRWAGVAASLLVLFLAMPWMLGEASDLDVRVLPFLFITIFATVRTGRRARWIAVIPLVLFTARTFGIAEHFAGAQPELAGLAHSFEIIPRGALVFPIVEGDQAPLERPFTHFWAYGVIRGGWFSPYLFDIPGQTPMRIVHNSYTSDGFWDLVYREPPDWGQVARDYDYIWAYGTPRFSPAMKGIGDRIYAHGSLEVYRIRKPQPHTL